MAMDQIGRYQVQGELGRGGMGVVYRAWDPVIRRPVAIKTIRLFESSDPAERQFLWERLLRESQTAGVLVHPSIVAIYDLFQQGDVAFLAMEFVDGPSLEKMLGLGTRLDTSLLLRILDQAAAALDYAHRMSVIHRDIKPANVLIHRDGTTKIADFGLAKIVDSPQVTRTGMTVGSPSYMAPEQIQGQAIDGRADQFALAVTAYEGLTGRRPFEAESVSALFFQIISQNPAPVSTLNPELAPGVEVVLGKALAKQPADRYGSCSEFTQALRAALEQREYEITRTIAVPVQEMAMAPVTADRFRAIRTRAFMGAPFLALALFAFHHYQTQPATSAAREDAPVIAAAATRPRLPEVPQKAASSAVAAPRARPRRIRYGDSGVHPELLREVQPVYPQLARTARIQGTVQLAIVIGTDGRIRQVQMLSGHPLLVPSAIEAVRQWVYRPPALNGAPVEVLHVVDVKFVLKT